MLLTQRNAEVNLDCLRITMSLFENGMIAEDQTDLKKEEVQEVIDKLTYSDSDSVFH